MKKWGDKKKGGEKVMERITKDLGSAGCLSLHELHVKITPRGAAVEWKHILHPIYQNFWKMCSNVKDTLTQELWHKNSNGRE